MNHQALTRLHKLVEFLLNKSNKAKVNKGPGRVVDPEPPGEGISSCRTKKPKT